MEKDGAGSNLVGCLEAMSTNGRLWTDMMMVSRDSASINEYDVHVFEMSKKILT